ncbi:MAG: hypothetical protein KDD37_07385 [Bdellovibrionales bacterium]|nr:hypothetical protein [Bdellovibrionales bacterium]
MKRLNKAFIALVVLVSAALVGGSWLYGLDTTHSQVAIFILAGLFALYYNEKNLILLDVIILPLAVAAVFSKGLMSFCIDSTIFYYLIYRFGPNTEDHSVFGIMLLLPPLLISKLINILPEPIIITASWVTLGVASINWPAKKYEYNESKKWIEWFYCAIAISLYVDIQLFNVINAQYVLATLGLLAMLSELPKLAMLLGLLTVHSIGAIDANVNMILFSTLWFEVYGIILLWLLSPFYLKQPEAIEIMGIYCVGLTIAYLSVVDLFNKSKYKEYWQVGVLFFVILIPAYETKSHWEYIQNNIEVQNWFALIPILATALGSYLVFTSKIKPLRERYNLAKLTYGLWTSQAVSESHGLEVLEFQQEEEVRFDLKESLIIFIIVSVAIVTMGFLCLASKV